MHLVGLHETPQHANTMCGRDSGALLQPRSLLRHGWTANPRPCLPSVLDSRQSVQHRDATGRPWWAVGRSVGNACRVGRRTHPSRLERPSTPHDFDLQPGFAKVSIRAEDVEGLARKAIAANWCLRNQRFLETADGARHERMKSARRHQLRDWISVLRIALDPVNRPHVQARLFETGPLMAHDLRNRVILARLDRRISDATSAMRPADASH